MSLSSLPRYEKYGAPVFIVQPHHIPYAEYFHQHSGLITTLTAPTADDGSSYTLQVASIAGFAAGQTLQVGNGVVEDTHPVIVGAPIGNLITLDRRIDFKHDIGATVERVYTNMRDRVGSMVAPEEYILTPNKGTIVYITRFLITMSHTTPGDLGTFGNLAKLINGISLRIKKDGKYHSITNWKTNEDIKADIYNVDFDTRSSGGGTYGTSGRGTFLNMGTAIELDSRTDDRLELYIQDDLTGLLTFTVKAQGYQEVPR